MNARSFWLWLHRWAGLSLAGLFVIVGSTGSILAFKVDVERLLCPEIYASPDPSKTPLEIVTLADHATLLAPEAKVEDVYLADPDQVQIGLKPKTNPNTGRPYVLGFDQILLDPRTGEELGRRAWGDLSEGRINVIPFVYKLHYELALGRAGRWILGIAALIATIDCFIGLYLTIPTTTKRFWTRWRSAWRIKWNARAFRIAFDLHRAGGLWLWAMLLVFAWSSVGMNLRDTVFHWVMRSLFDYHPAMIELAASSMPNENPRIDFRAAYALGERLMDERSAQEGFRVMSPVGLGYLPSLGVYNYFVRSSRDIRESSPRSYLFFDGDTGAIRFLELPTGQFSGNTFASWLDALHMAEVFGLPYRILVFVSGIVIAVLSITGIYIWEAKRRARNTNPRTSTSEHRLRSSGGL